MNMLTELIPVTSEFKLIRKERSFESEFTGQSQVLSDPVSYWAVELVFKNIPNKEARKLIGTLAKLRGAGGHFRLKDHSNCAADGLGGQYVVDYFSTSLPGLVAIKGAPDSKKLADVGDMVEINGELKMVLGEVVGSYENVAWIEIEPWMRAPVTGGERVTFNEPTGLFHLPPNFEIPRLTSKKLVHAEITIEAIEVLTK
ncbi:hypothetical protein ACEV8V_23180 [Vibrio parahaemolyticus]|nr:hypothetical protein [Vibrio parahaemolyticus]HCH1695064.1 hypothetical protein [Vibrio parahaemolyticus]HCH1697745.1 hypothetical protein [Vibrio parahaemolyticus]HCH5256255.1 hypothetical protein [Vibrio parahaemolyticus]